MGVLWVRVGVGVCVGVRVGVRVGARPPHSANGRRDGLSSTSTVTDMVLQGGVRMWRGGVRSTSMVISTDLAQGGVRMWSEGQVRV